jgi:hypothetical protein
MKVKTLLPAGRPLHGMLATHYTQLRSLIYDLKETRFSGYLKLEFWEYEGYLIFDTGNIVQIYERDHDKLNSGRRALLNIEKRFQDKDGTISTYAVDSEFVLFIFGKFENKIIKESENLDRNQLQDFIEESKLDVELGFIDVVFGEDRMWASFYILNGQVVAVATKNSEGRERFEKGQSELYQKILQMAGTIKNIVSLKSCSALKSYEENQNFNQILDLLELTRFAVVLIKRLGAFIDPLSQGLSAEQYFSDIWQQCSNETGIKAVSYKNGQFNGLEKTTLSDFGYLFSKVLKKVKPTFDKATTGSSYLEQILRSYTVYNESLQTNSDLLDYIMYFRQIKKK